jgi:putative transposase
VFITHSQQEAEPKVIRAEFPDYAAVHSHALHDVLARLDTTYQAFFSCVANGEKPGFARLHGTDRSHAFTDTEYGNGARLENGSLVLAKIGCIAVRWSRPIAAGTIKTVTISREADGWYVCFSCADVPMCRGAEVPVEPLPLTGRETGIDVGHTVLLITAEGEAVANPRHSRTAECALKKAHQRASRRTKGSTRRRTAVQVLAKAQQHVRCLRHQRRDFHHKTALALVRQYDVVSVEAIQPANVSRRLIPRPDVNGTGTGTGGYEHNGAIRKAGLNTSILVAGWGRFFTILAYTAACAGKRVEAVPPAYTSRDCSGGGERIYKSLSVRTHVCTHCGLILDRDLNAARNIHWRGQRLWGLVGMPAVAAVAEAMNREPAGLEPLRSVRGVWL